MQNNLTLEEALQRIEELEKEKKEMTMEIALILDDLNRVWKKYLNKPSNTHKKFMQDFQDHMKQ